MTDSAVSHALNAPLMSVRDALSEKCIRLLVAYRKACVPVSSPGQLVLPETLKLLPFLTLSLMKSRAFRKGCHFYRLCLIFIDQALT